MQKPITPSFQQMQLHPVHVLIKKVDVGKKWSTKFSINSEWLTISDTVKLNMCSPTILFKFFKDNIFTLTYKYL
jgi:hypothetical protein